MWRPWWALPAEEKFDYVVVAQDDPAGPGHGGPSWQRPASRLSARDKAAARIEASKVFSKDLMKKYGIPTAKYEVV